MKDYDDDDKEDDNDDEQRTNFNQKCSLKSKLMKMKQNILKCTIQWVKGNVNEKVQNERKPV